MTGDPVRPGARHAGRNRDRPDQTSDSSRRLEPKSRGGRDVAGLATRQTAVTLLRQVLERRVPLDALVDETHGTAHFRALQGRDRALVRAILGAALRHRGDIDAIIVRCLDRPLPPQTELLAAILHVAVAQILYLDVPDHAAVDLAVTQTGGDRRTGRARGLVNSVLRRVARERRDLLAAASPERNAPAWLFERWTAACGAETARLIAAAHMAQPPLDLTVASDAAGWAARLAGTLLPTGNVRLTEAGRVSALPGYDDGAWWVQDAAAALPARLLGDVRGRAVADLCAAPGGKTAQLAAAGALVTAVDLSQARLKRLKTNLGRLGFDAQVVTADVLAWTPERLFDAVLLDAPCSATGTIRRHPDVAWLKRPEDVAALAALQRRMFHRAAATVAPGGHLVICTCSLEPEEGVAHVAPFLAANPDFAPDPIAPAEIAGQGHLLSTDGMLRTLPCDAFRDPAGEPVASGMDGFFAARFRRVR